MKEILKQKVNSILFQMGMSEKYIAFEYLSIIVTRLIEDNNDTKITYKQALKDIMEQYHVTERTIIQGLNHIMKNCTQNELSKQLVLELKHNTYNKILIIKNYVNKNLI